MGGCIWPQGFKALLVFQSIGQVFDRLFNGLLIPCKLLLQHLLLNGGVDGPLEIVACNHFDHLLSDAVLDGLLASFVDGEGGGCEACSNH